MTEWDVVLRLLVAAFCGGLIGYERERHGRAAGLRTHMLVCLGSTLIMLTGIHMADVHAGRMVLDPTRLGAQVVSGIGFLGAGAILRFRASVRGLTTAASLWAVAGLGLAVGSGFYSGVVVFTILVLLVLLVVSGVEHRLIRKDWYVRLVVEGRGSPDELAGVRQVLARHQGEIKDVEVEKIPDRGTRLELSVKLLSRSHMDVMLSEMLQISGIDRARWIDT